MEIDNKKVFTTLNLNKIWVPLLLGLGVVTYLFMTDPDMKADQLRLIGEGNWLYILLAICLVVVRDLGYTYRIRTLTHKNLSWVACLYVIVLWEFSSAVTPSVVGGSLVAIFLLHKEGVKVGKALAYVMVTSIFDNLFFIVAAPLGLLNFRNYLSESTISMATQWGGGISFIFWLSYLLILVYTVLMSFALFVKPFFFKWFLVKITSIKFLRKWNESAAKHGDDIIMASQALQGEKWSYWVEIGMITCLVWTVRYSVLNMLLAAYVPVSLVEHGVIFGKHIIMWIIMLISPTPGSSGTAEFFFKQLYGGLLGEYVLITAIVWRAITYYFYLLLGVIVLPRWLKRVF
ncbi:MAG: hypothetical protein BGO68_01930 [Candidatus Amoebophilus sp. 36-38]|nr:MAG: hypothetical protein BGO68_01930 [Candidatus Amoebophilus sp. 36-38]